MTQSIPLKELDVCAKLQVLEKTFQLVLESSTVNIGNVSIDHQMSVSQETV